MIDFSCLLFVDCKVTLWDKATDRPSNQSQEIIGIDVALVDIAKSQIIEQDALLVKTLKSKISTYCEGVYGIKQSKIDAQGVDFSDAYRHLRIHHMFPDRNWASWSTLDASLLNRHCRAHKLDPLVIRPPNDVQYLYSLFTGKPIGSIEQSLKDLNIKSTGNSAADIAKIFLQLSNIARKTTIISNVTSINKNKTISPAN